MEKNILIQYTDLQAEIKDIIVRREKLKDKISNMAAVGDSVTGTRPDGTIGSITIKGFPEPEYYRSRSLIRKYEKLLEVKQIELLELTTRTEEYIESIEKSELRTIFRLFFLDNLSYIQVANRMNTLHPKRKKKYTDENIRKKIQRFFENVPQCPDLK